jgi:hypothetical protein
VNDSMQIELSSVNASGVVSTTDEAGLSHARFGTDGKSVNDIAATTYQPNSFKNRRRRTRPEEEE